MNPTPSGSCSPRRRRCRTPTSTSVAPCSPRGGADKALRRANQRLTEELDKHAGRLHHALSQRLDNSRQRFTDVTRTTLDNTIDDIDQAIVVAEQRGDGDADAAAAALERARHALDLAT